MRKSCLQNHLQGIFRAFWSRRGKWVAQTVFRARRSTAGEISIDPTCWQPYTCRESWALLNGNGGVP